MSDLNIRLWPGWKIVRELGKGSYGTVYEIQRSTGSFLERAALKVIRIPSNPAEIEQLWMNGLGEADTENYLRQHVEEILHEIALMQRLVGYSNIVSYEDYMVDRHRNEKVWDILIRMELLMPLTKYMASRSMSEQDVIRLGIDISEALKICHSAGIIHRDIKPQNIFINRQGFYKLGDFGISRAVPGSGSVLSFKGTVPYMAPETFSMRGTDERSDIYSLALVLYRILNGGREPFISSSKFTAADLDEAQRRRMSGEPLPRPASGSYPVWTVLSRALAMNPAERYQTAADFQAALQGAASGRTEERFPGLRVGGTLVLQSMEQGMPGGFRPRQSDTLESTWADDVTKMDDDRRRDPGTRNPSYGPAGIGKNDRGKYGGQDSGWNAGGGTLRDPGTGQAGAGTRQGRKLLMGALVILLLTMLVSLVVLLVPLWKGGSGGAANKDPDKKGDGVMIADSGTDGREPPSGDSGGNSGPDADENGNSAEKPDNSGAQAAGGQQSGQYGQGQSYGDYDTGVYDSDNAGSGQGYGLIDHGFQGGENSDYDDDTEPVSAAEETIEPVQEEEIQEAAYYSIICMDEDGFVLYSMAGGGNAGQDIVLNAPEIPGYTPRKKSIPVHLPGAEEDTTVEFIYDKTLDIPDTAMHYNGHSYYAYVSSQIDSFWDAAAFSEEMGGYLAVINTEDENRALYEYVFDQMGYKSAYFGYTDDDSEGSWYWVGADSSTYENWLNGQPDNLKHGDKRENFALFFYQDTRYKWNDGDFGPDKNGNVIFLIEWDRT